MDVIINSKEINLTYTNETFGITANKYDENGQNLLSGAKLELLDSTGKVIEEAWDTTSDGGHLINAKLKVGKTYTLKEVSTPNGYVYARDVEYTVTNEKIQEIPMVNHKIKLNVIKLDENNNPLKSALLDFCGVYKNSSLFISKTSQIKIIQTIQNTIFQIFLFTLFKVSSIFLSS